MAEVHHFAYGLVNPILAYALSFLGSLLGLVLTARSRELTGRGRARWLVLAAVAIGGAGIWLMHFMAMLGFDVPDSVVRYDPWITAASAMVAMLIVGIGLFTVGFGRLSVAKIALGGTFIGLGVAAMHYSAMAGTNVGGHITYDALRVTFSILIAVIAAIVALWFAVAITSASATVWAALLMGLAVCSMHYTGMSAMHIRLEPVGTPVPGVGPFTLLMPICVIACVMITLLAFGTVGFSVRQENARADAQLFRSRAQVIAAAGRLRSVRRRNAGPPRPRPGGGSRVPIGAGSGPHR